MAESLVYRSSLLYEAIMLALYGRHYPARYRAVAELIRPGWRVLDLCCGPAILYGRHLRRKGVDYTGLDLNPRFAQRVGRLGGRGLVWDLAGPDPLPEADAVVMQASLYHFLPDPRPVLGRMLRAARRRLIVAEPIRNLSTSGLPLLAALARRQTDAGRGPETHRFDEATLDALISTLTPPPSRSFVIPGGREKVFIFDVEEESHAGEDG